MQSTEISPHELLVYLVLKSNKGEWLTNTEIGNLAEGMSTIRFSPRTVRAHTARMVEAGLVDRVPVFPAHKFRLAAKTAKQDSAYLKKLELAHTVFGQFLRKSNAK